MDEKKENKKVENTQETTKNFKAVQNPSTYKTVYQNNKKEASNYVYCFRRFDVICSNCAYEFIHF